MYSEDAKLNRTTLFADRVIDFNKKLEFTGTIPADFKVLNPFFDNPETLLVMREFYTCFYSDSQKRKFIIGINPSRHGAGVTGVPFTDTKRLETECGIKMSIAYTHEISSVFMYDMIAEYGGVHRFYSNFYINSPFPLAIVRKNASGKWVNANYYDDLNFFDQVKEFMVESLRQSISLGLDTSEVFVLGKKNAHFIEKLNQHYQLFEKLTVLEHPRYIQQYKSKEKMNYIDKYILAFNGVCPTTENSLD